MKKHLPIILGVLAGLFLSTLSALSFERKNAAQLESASVQQALSMEGSLEKSEFVPSKKAAAALIDPADVQDALLKNSKSSASSQKKDSNTVKAAVSKKTANVSSKKISKSKAELLDWWKSARYVFKIGAVAEVTDIRTGKSFKIKRTMGTNHADCEALTKKDTDIIKSIWGGFNWDVRPVYVKVGGRKLIASMSAMPHAGVDAAPAYAVVSRRSGGYSRGENLDVVKGNGMNGHFDVHFLNSRRHKDNKEDPRHQSAILKAAGKK